MTDCKTVLTEGLDDRKCSFAFGVSCENSAKVQLCVWCLSVHLLVSQWRLMGPTDSLLLMWCGGPSCRLQGTYTCGNWTLETGQEVRVHRLVWLVTFMWHSQTEEYCYYTMYNLSRMWTYKIGVSYYCRLIIFILFTFMPALKGLAID